MDNIILSIGGKTSSAVSAGDISQNIKEIKNLIAAKYNVREFHVGINTETVIGVCSLTLLLKHNICNNGDDTKIIVSPSQIIVDWATNYKSGGSQLASTKTFSIDTCDKTYRSLRDQYLFAIEHISMLAKEAMLTDTLFDDYGILKDLS